MRCSPPAFCLVFMSLGPSAGASLAADQPVAPQSAVTAPPATTSPAAKPIGTSPAKSSGSSPTKTPTPSAAQASEYNEAAAKHAKRTACLSQARTKKLVGAQRTAYVKGCIGQN
jgi:hypothetical protein